MAKKGSAEERDLVHKLWDRHFAAMRAPASGGATKKPLPDVIAGNGVEFSNIFGATPYLGAKFKHTKWLFLSPEMIQRTKNGNYKVEKDYSLEKALEIDEICGFDKQVKF